MNARKVHKFDKEIPGLTYEALSSSFQWAYSLITLIFQSFLELKTGSIRSVSFKLSQPIITQWKVSSVISSSIKAFTDYQK